MATAAGKSSSNQKSRGEAASPDAVELLMADHRQVEAWFEEFEDSDETDVKEELAAKICEALRTHTTIEEEIFYPAFLDATDDTDLHHEAVVEHAGAKNLIGEIEESDSDDEYFDAKVKVLSEMIKHHVKEEEQPGGMFAEAKKSEMDLAELGREMQARKEELAAELDEEEEEDEDEHDED